LRFGPEVGVDGCDAGYSIPRRSDVVPRCGPASASMYWRSRPRLTPGSRPPGRYASLVTLRYQCFATTRPVHPCTVVRRAMRLTPDVAASRPARRCAGVRRSATHPAAVQKRSRVIGPYSAVAVTSGVCRPVSKLFPRFLSRRERLLGVARGRDGLAGGRVSTSKRGVVGGFHRERTFYGEYRPEADSLSAAQDHVNCAAAWGARPCSHRHRVSSVLHRLKRGYLSAPAIRWPTSRPPAFVR
jgi:hypothetical protein